jgi:glyoxylase-like metal-dependent hydrolase (beta-lactamase superfamily II)
MEEILPDLYKVKIPLPNISLPGINCYIIKNVDRFLIVDPGLNHDQSLASIQEALTCLSVNMARIDFFLTHMHIDHMGLMLRLRSSDSKIYVGQGEKQPLESDWDGIFSLALAHGFPEDELPSLLLQHPGYVWTKSGSAVDLPYHIKQENEVLRVGNYSFTIIETPGHSEGHLCLYEPIKKILISGDHILKKITPSIDVWSEEDDPLFKFLKSLNKIEKLGVKWVLPGHGQIFTDCKVQIKKQKAHRLARTNEIVHILKQTHRNAYELASQVDWNIRGRSWDNLSALQKWFSTLEVLAHLFYLEKKGLVRRHGRGAHLAFSLSVSRSPIAST